MSVTRARDEQREEYLAAVENIVKSHALHGSESLCKLLRYLAQHALESPGTALKEYQIATEVFGRPADFDLHLDSIIRVQAGRLRIKLAEYYASEGAEGPIVVEFPKGTYALTFHRRTVAAKPQLETAPSAKPVAVGVRNWRIAVLVLSVLLAVTAAALAGLWRSQRNSLAAVLQDPPAPQPIATFWKGFLAGSEEPWVIF